MHRSKIPIGESEAFKPVKKHKHKAVHITIRLRVDRPEERTEEKHQNSQTATKNTLEEPRAVEPSTSQSQAHEKEPAQEDDNEGVRSDDIELQRSSEDDKEGHDEGFHQKTNESGEHSHQKANESAEQGLPSEIAQQEKQADRVSRGPVLEPLSFDQVEEAPRRRLLLRHLFIYPLQLRISKAADVRVKISLKDRDNEDEGEEGTVGNSIDHAVSAYTTRGGKPKFVHESRVALPGTVPPSLHLVFDFYETQSAKSSLDTGGETGTERKIGTAVLPLAASHDVLDTNALQDNWLPVACGLLPHYLQSNRQQRQEYLRGGKPIFHVRVVPATTVHTTDPDIGAFFSNTHDFNRTSKGSLVKSLKALDRAAINGTIDALEVTNFSWSCMILFIRAILSNNPELREAAIRCCASMASNLREKSGVNALYEFVDGIWKGQHEKSAGELASTVAGELEKLLHGDDSRRFPERAMKNMDFFLGLCSRSIRLSRMDREDAGELAEKKIRSLIQSVAGHMASFWQNKERTDAASVATHVSSALAMFISDTVNCFPVHTVEAFVNDCSGPCPSALQLDLLQRLAFSDVLAQIFLGEEPENDIASCLRSITSLLGEAIVANFQEAEGQMNRPFSSVLSDILHRDAHDARFQLRKTRKQMFTFYEPLLRRIIPVVEHLCKSDGAVENERRHALGCCSAIIQHVPVEILAKLMYEEQDEGLSRILLLLEHIVSEFAYPSRDGASCIEIDKGIVKRIVGDETKGADTALASVEWRQPLNFEKHSEPVPLPNAKPKPKMNDFNKQLTAIASLACLRVVRNLRETHESEPNQQTLTATAKALASIMADSSQAKLVVERHMETTFTLASEVDISHGTSVISLLRSYLRLCASHTPHFSEMGVRGVSELAEVARGLNWSQCGDENDGGNRQGEINTVQAVLMHSLWDLLQHPDYSTKSALRPNLIDLAEKHSSDDVEGPLRSMAEACAHRSRILDVEQGSRFDKAEARLNYASAVSSTPVGASMEMERLAETNASESSFAEAAMARLAAAGILMLSHDVARPIWVDRHFKRLQKACPFLRAVNIDPCEIGGALCQCVHGSLPKTRSRAITNLESAAEYFGNEGLYRRKAQAFRLMAPALISKDDNAALAKLYRNLASCHDHLVNQPDSASSCFYLVYWGPEKGGYIHREPKGKDLRTFSSSFHAEPKKVQQLFAIKSDDMEGDEGECEEGDRFISATDSSLEVRASGPFPWVVSRHLCVEAYVSASACQLDQALNVADGSEHDA